MFWEKLMADRKKIAMKGVAVGIVAGVILSLFANRILVFALEPTMGQMFAEGFTIVVTAIAVISGIAIALGKMNLKKIERVILNTTAGVAALFSWFVIPFIPSLDGMA